MFELTPPKRLNAYQVLRNKFPDGEYVLLAEVSDASGHDRSRSLDFMIINLWKSRGLAVTGIEKKSNRGDWLKELKNPAKQENHFKYCEYFYLLTDKDGVAKIEEIPPTWGWYHINDKGMLKTMKAAPKLKSIPIERSFLCAMLRRAACKKDFIHTDSVDGYIQTAAEQMYKSRNAMLERDAEAYSKLKEEVEIFEKFSGINITYNYGDIEKIGEAVRIIRNGELPNFYKRFERFKREIVDLATDLDEKIKILKDKDANILH